jgi:hypothetical protein
MLLAGLLCVNLSACLTRPVITNIPPANCSELIPPGIAAAIAGTPFPAGDTTKDWQAFGLSEGAARVMANRSKADAIDIVKICERKDAELRAAVTKRKKFLGIF